MGLVVHYGDGESLDLTQLAPMGVKRISVPCRNHNRKTGRKCEQPVVLANLSGEFHYAFPPNWKVLDTLPDNTTLLKLWGGAMMHHMEEMVNA